jgi:glutamine amidotransferase
LVEEFFSHADENPHGWGFADFSFRAASIIKSPERADQGVVAASLLARPLLASNALVHIRKATVGQIEEANCHPYTAHDRSGRQWTLIHKGTIFDYSPLDPYFHRQQGSTDSERILLYLIDKLDARREQRGAPLEADERFAVFEELVREVSPGNALGLLLYDSDQFYVHANYRGSLSFYAANNRTLFCTSALESAKVLPGGEWQPLPLCTAYAYRHGQMLYLGEPHGFEYIDKEEDTRYLYQDFAGL